LTHQGADFLSGDVEDFDRNMSATRNAILDRSVWESLRVVRDLGA
jgi:hypothetical protein